MSALSTKFISCFYLHRIHHTYARRHLSFHYLIKSNKYLFNLKTKQKTCLSFKKEIVQDLKENHIIIN